MDAASHWLSETHLIYLQNATLLSVPLAGGAPSLLAPDIASALMFTPDRERAIFSRTGSPATIWSVNARGPGEPLKLTDAKYPSLALSPDGAHALFFATGGFGIASVPTAGGPPAMIGRPSRLTDYVTSRDGAQMALYDMGSEELAVVNFDGQRRAALPTPDVVGGWQVLGFAPDGKAVLATSLDRDLKEEAVLFPVDGGARTLVFHGAGFELVGFGAAGNVIGLAYKAADQSPELVLVRPQGERVSFGPVERCIAESSQRRVTLSGDGSRVAYLDLLGKLHVVDTASGAELGALEGSSVTGSTCSSLLRFSPDQQTLLAAGCKNESCELVVLSRDGHKLTTLDEGVSTPRSFSFSPDGRYVFVPLSAYANLYARSGTQFGTLEDPARSFRWLNATQAVFNGRPRVHNTAVNGLHLITLP